MDLTTHYRSMTFLRDHIVPRKTKSNFVSVFLAKKFQFFSQHATYLSEYLTKYSVQKYGTRFVNLLYKLILPRDLSIIINIIAE